MAEHLEVQWKRDEAAECLMESLGLEWEDTEVSIEAIDWQTSINNGARLDSPLVDSAIEDYMQAMQNGDRFPVPTVWWVKGKSPSVQSGVQRTESVRRLIKDGAISPSIKLPVHSIVSNDKMAVDTFTRCANNIHGRGPDKEARVQQAVYCVRSLGMKTCDASKLFIVSTVTITDRIRADDTRRLLAKAGVNGTSAFAIKTCTRLARLDDEQALVQLGHVVASGNPSAERVGLVVDEVNKATTKAARTKAIRQFEQELKTDQDRVAPERNVVISKPRRDKLLGMVSRLATFLDKGNDGEGFQDLSQLQCESSEAELKRSWNRALYRMQIILGG